MTVDFSDILRTHAESMQSEGFYTVANALNRAADEHERKDHALDFGAKLVSELSKKIEDLCARVAASEQDAAQWKARESETQEALQAIGEEFGVRGGEPRVDGIRRVLTEKEKALALSGATLMKLDRTNAELSDALTAAMDCIAGGLAALNASYQQANAEAAGHDKTADRLDKIVQAWRAQARAMVSARPAPARGTL